MIWIPVHFPNMPRNASIIDSKHRPVVTGVVMARVYLVKVKQRIERHGKRVDPKIGIASLGKYHAQTPHTSLPDIVANGR